MIWDARAGWPRPTASPRVADIDCRHRRCHCPPRLHRATTTTGFLPAVATLVIDVVSPIAAVAPVLLVFVSAAADAVSP